MLIDFRGGFLLYSGRKGGNLIANLLRAVEGFLLQSSSAATWTTLLSAGKREVVCLDILQEVRVV